MACLGQQVQNGVVLYGDLFARLFVGLGLRLPQHQGEHQQFQQQNSDGNPEPE